MGLQIEFGTIVSILCLARVCLISQLTNFLKHIAEFGLLRSTYVMGKAGYFCEMNSNS